MRFSGGGRCGGSYSGCGGSCGGGGGGGGWCGSGGGGWARRQGSLADATTIRIRLEKFD